MQKKLGSKKPMFLNQIKYGSFNSDDIIRQLQTWKDLSIGDLRGVISDEMFNEVKRKAEGAEKEREAQAAWNEILHMENENVPFAQLMDRVKDFISKYPSSVNVGEARAKLRDLEGKIPPPPPSPGDNLWNMINEKYQSLTTQIQQNDIDDEPSNQQLIIDGQNLLSKLREFETRFFNHPKIGDVARIRSDVDNALNYVREENEWRRIDKNYYAKLKQYHVRFPNSIHNDELDELMWLLTKRDPTLQNFDRYIVDWPNGQYVEEALNARDEIRDWEAVKRPKMRLPNNDWLLAVKKYWDAHPGSPFESEIQALYYQLRDEVLNKMRKNPTKFDQYTVEAFINANIFDFYELCDGEIMTEESWNYLRTLDRDRFPQLQQYQVDKPDITAPEGSTDIYFFGTPGTGKTCLLMGLAGANGQGYSLNMRSGGGPYASALQQYVIGRITPGRTFGNYVTTINSNIIETDRKGRIVNHSVNFIEMSGEEFALRIANSKKKDSMELENSFAQMGTGVTNLLTNNNRKVFFIVVDCSGDQVDFNYIEEVKDEEGVVIEQRTVQTYISQLDILNKFISLFRDPANQKIMEKVDAIHFIVTKADMLSKSPVERKEKARDMLLSKYIGPVSDLKSYCQQTRRINNTSKYAPKAFTFSLGKFYLGDIFDFDNTETLLIVDTIKSMTLGAKEKSFWDKLADLLN